MLNPGLYPVRTVSKCSSQCMPHNGVVLMAVAVAGTEKRTKGKHAGEKSAKQPCAP